MTDQLGDPPGDRGSPLAMAEMFADIGRQLAAHSDSRAAVQALTELTVRVVPGACWASVTRGTAERFSTMAASGQVAVEADLLQYRLGTGPCVDAVINDAVFTSRDLALDDRWSQFGPQAARDFGTRSVLSMRLVMDGDEDLNAGLNIYADHVDAFDDEAYLLATLLATHAAVAVGLVVEREQSRQLRDALDSSREIGIAMGVLMATSKVTREQAFDLLRIASQNTNRKVRDIATVVADSGVLDLPRLRRRT